MVYRKYRLSGGLTEEDLKNIHREILVVLEKIGVEIDHPAILAFLAGQKGIEVKGKRVHYDRKLVEDFIPQIKQQNAEYSYNRKGEEKFRMLPPYMGRYYTDIDTGETRLATLNDCIAAVKLCDSYQMYGPSPIHLQTVPVHLRQVATEKVCVENSREMGGWCVAENIKEADLMCRIGQVSGRKPPYCALEIPISPLRLNHNCLDVIYQNRNHQYNLSGICLGGGAAPMPGASAPIFFPGMLVQGMAEALAAYITPKLIDPEVYGYCSFGGFIFDVRKMQPAKPFPESILYCLAVSQVIKYVLGEKFGVDFACNINSLSDVFRVAFALGMGICDGATSVIGIGGDSSGTGGELDGFNPVMAVIQADIVRHCERFAGGLKLDEEKGISLKVIEEAIYTGMPNSFLDHPTTLQHREIYLEPELFFKFSGEELKEKARETARKKIAEHNFSLPGDKREAIEKIYREADRTLGKKPG
ncbi:MAG: trimethylamine methyltransferase family protein [Candidatus Omnitrophota bacterium]